MIIDFNSLEEKEIPSFKGGKKQFNVKMFSDDSVKLMLGKLQAGASIGIHTHEGNSEIVFIISGHGKVYYDGEYESVKAGQCHYCPMGHTHSLINDSNEDLIFYAAVPEIAKD